MRRFFHLVPTRILATVAGVLAVVLVVGLSLREGPTVAPSPVVVAPPVAPRSGIDAPAIDASKPIVVPPVDRVGPDIHDVYVETPGGRSHDRRIPVVVDPSDMTATAARLSTVSPPTLMEELGRRLGVPVRRYEANVAQQVAPIVLSPIDWVVDREGRFVVSAPQARAWATMGLGLAASLAVGTFLAFLLSMRQGGHYGPYWEDGEDRFVGTVVTIGGVTWFGSTIADLPYPEVLFVSIAALVASRHRWRERVVSLGWAMAILGLWRLGRIEIVDPYPSVADQYGPLGIHVWDAVWIGGAILAFVLWRTSAIRFDRSVTVNAPSGPLVQDVRIVDRR